MNKYEYLTDDNFLKKIDSLHIQEQYVKIILLDWKEFPIKEIHGMVTSGGSININGDSSVRRVSNISLYVDNSEIADVMNVENYFSINKKIKIEIGIKNITREYSDYDIIWFPQGTYVIMSPSLSHDLNGVNISLQLRDKMSLLNGDAGGILTSSVQFDQYETIDENGEYIITKVKIHQIIRELVNHYGGEQLGKIIINDIPDKIKQVMKWTGKNPLYFIHNNGTYLFSINEEDIKNLDKNLYTIFNYGEDVGYIYTDFVSPSEIISNPGESIVSVLDKIKNLLGNYEYFYDIDGNFVFQEIKNYLNTTQATVISNEISQDYSIDISKGKAVYILDDTDLILSTSNNPQYNMIKNDYVVWGIRKNANGNDIPIRYHLAIDDKPETGNRYECFLYTDPDDNLQKAKVPIKFKDKETLENTDGAAGVFYMTTDDGKIYKWENKQYKEINVELIEVETKDWRTELYLQGASAEALGLEQNYYYAELNAEWPKIYDIAKNSYEENGKRIYYGDFKDEIITTPNEAVFFLDFIDTDSELGKFSVNTIGRRSIVVKSNDINCIFESYIPDYVLIENDQPDTQEKREECQDRGQKFIQVDSSIFKRISTGGSNNSAFEEIKNLLYQYTSYNESISINMLPIYHLEPNTRISVRDLENDISGDYIISTISVPLEVGGTTVINAQKALQKI